MTGGINSAEPLGISTTDLFSTGEEYGSDEPQNTFLQGPILREAVSHHCLIKTADLEKYLLIGGKTPTNAFSSKV